MAGPPITERRRLAISAFVGGSVGASIAPFVVWELAILVTWDMTAIIFVAWTWLVVGPMDADRTRDFATREDGSRASTRVMLTIASTASLIGVLVALVEASKESGVAKLMFTATGLATVVGSWALVHTLYALRYAHLYYSDQPGGIDFKNDAQSPAYLDFAYVAFSVGMTFQVSDTDVQSAVIRRTVLKQALLAYLFGTIIVASAINIIAGLLK